MRVGKTYSTISKKDIFNSKSEVDILNTFFPIKKLPCCINSPFREDNHPSFSIRVNKNNHIRYFDYATEEHGGLMDFLCKYWNCSFSQAIDRIYSETAVLPSYHHSKKATSLVQKLNNNTTKIEVKVRKWEDYDFKYWQTYGISPKWLRYAEVFPISHKIITKTNPTTNKEIQIVFGADKYAYVFVERKENDIQLKIYQPFNTKGYKWCSKMDSSVISLWTKIPEQGDKLIICSSLKDALCVSCQLHIPTIALQGEGYSISNTALKELKRRYKQIFIAFDTDKAGIEDGKKLSEHTGFIQVIPNLGQEKDFSDYYKSLQNKQDFQKLKTLFI